MRGRESTNDSLKWELLGYAAVIDLSSSLRGGTKIPSVLEAEERVVNIFHGKTTQTLPPPPQLFPGPRFLSKPAFSVLLHNTRFCSIHSSSPCQQVLLGSRNMDFCGNGHFTQSAKRYWKVKLGVVWRAVGEMGRCVQVAGLPCPACSISPSPECPRDREQSPQAKFTVGSS